MRFRTARSSSALRLPTVCALVVAKRSCRSLTRSMVRARSARPSSLALPDASRPNEESVSSSLRSRSMIRWARRNCRFPCCMSLYERPSRLSARRNWPSVSPSSGTISAADMPYSRHSANALRRRMAAAKLTIMDCPWKEFETNPLARLIHRRGIGLTFPTMTKTYRTTVTQSRIIFLVGIFFLFALGCVEIQVKTRRKW